MVSWQMIRTWFRLTKKNKDKIQEQLFFQVDDFTYHFAEKEDIEALLEVEQDIYEELPWNYQHFYREIVENPQASFILAKKEEEAVAYIGMNWHKKYCIFNISNFVVKTNYQSQGLGSCLLNYALEFSKILEIFSVNLKVDQDNQKAKVFYQYHGFKYQKTIENYYNNGHTAIEMRKELISESNLSS
ncbi:MAG: GNAT family N-acetyltransferase [Lactovum sp.]